MQVDFDMAYSEGLRDLEFKKSKATQLAEKERKILNVKGTEAAGFESLPWYINIYLHT